MLGGLKVKGVGVGVRVGVGVLEEGGVVEGEVEWLVVGIVRVG